MILKAKDIKNMNEKERKEKLKALRMELIKRKADQKTKPKEIKKAIARILTLKQKK